jgi:hypothetical protein
VCRQHRRIEDHRVHPIRVAHSDTGGQVGAVGGAVDDRLVDPGVVEDRRDVVHGVVDGQRCRPQIVAVVGVAGHSDSAMVNHDDVQAFCGGAPS